MNQLSDTEHQAAQDTKLHITHTLREAKQVETGLMVGERSGFSCKEEEPRQNLVLTLRSGYSWESIEATQFEYKE